MEKGYIYSIRNKVNNKYYIGQTVDYQRRINEHRYRHTSNRVEHQNNSLYRAMRKYGIENFEFKILEEVSMDEINEKEQEYVSKFDSYKNGYNQTVGGNRAPANVKLTEKDVILVRTFYKERVPYSKRQIWEKYFKDKITLGYFSNLWRGENWSHIMPEVFTEENKEFYKRYRPSSIRGEFSDEEVIEIRIAYKNMTAKEIYKKYGKGRITFRGMEALLRSQTYKHLPHYKEIEEDYVYEKIKI